MKPSWILEKLGAGRELVDTARTLENLSEERSSRTMLGLEDRLARAAMASQIYADPMVRNELMKQQAAYGGVGGGLLGGALGYGAAKMMGGSGSRGAALGILGGGLLGAGVGAGMGYHKARRAANILEYPEVQQEVVSRILDSMYRGSRAKVL